MAVTLGHNQYGKAETHVVRVFRDTEPHEIVDYNVSVALRGDFVDVHLTGDNRKCLTTDATKNTVNSFAKEAGDAVRQPESFGIALAKHFVDDVPQVERARIQIEAYPWDRLRRAPARVLPPRRLRPHRDGHLLRRRQLWVVSGVRELVVLKTTDSEFHTFYEERYTTLQPTTDRIMASSVTAQWLHTDLHTDWGSSYDRVLATLGSTFAGHHSLALQQTLYAMGEAIIEEQPEIAEIRFSLPNKHHFLVDLSPFGVKNSGEVFHADDRPYGYIEGTVRRDDAPNPGPAAFDPGQGW